MNLAFILVLFLGSELGIDRNSSFNAILSPQKLKHLNFRQLNCCNIKNIVIEKFIKNMFFLKKLFNKSEQTLPKEQEMKYLIVGLGNIGVEYEKTRHNIGFQVVEYMAQQAEAQFKSDKLAFRAEIKYKGRILVLIKPTTYMNLSGKSVNYWLQKEKVELDKLLIIVDDLALPFGSLRIKTKGSDGGHNGLANINQTIGNEYARIRFGIGDAFSKGKQIDYVLGTWSEAEEKLLPERIEKMSEAVKSFVSIGIERTMNFFNGK